MPLVAAPAPPCLIADTIQVLDDAALDGLWNFGARALGAYLEILAAHPGLLERYTARGFGVLPIGESPSPGWKPNATTGAETGARHVRLAQQLAIPAGVVLVDDFETPEAHVTTTDRCAHVDVRAQAVVAAAFLAGVYIGQDAGLTSAEWQARPNVRRYGKSASELYDHMGVPIFPSRGWSWIQGEPVNYPVGSAKIDPGFLLRDYRGDAMVLVYDDRFAPS